VTKKIKKETKLWLDQAVEHWKDAVWLLEGRRYSACLFYCHQTLEKALKAATVETQGKIPPKGHQLESLARKSGLVFQSGWLEDLAEITRHFWRVRYPDYQQAVYTSKEKIMPTYQKTEEIYIWITKQLLKDN